MSKGQSKIGHGSSLLSAAKKTTKNINIQQVTQQSNTPFNNYDNNSTHLRHAEDLIKTVEYVHFLAMNKADLN